tara:strand:+ start:2582 stop:2896 length:315 start_codon:yes stop_codon:yes gene_type:complete
MSTIEILCVDDSNRPEDIPITHWVKHGEVYTLKDVKSLLMQGGHLGLQVDEINLLELGNQYEFFGLYRFSIQEKDIQAFKDVIIASYKADKISSDDLNKLFNIN